MIQKIIFEILENEFKKNNYSGNANKDFVIKNGKYPILISAPHTIKHTNLLGKEKLPEYYTGSLAKYLSLFTNVFLIYKTGNKSKSDSDIIYRKAIRNIIEENHIELFIELHGCKDTYGFDIEIGTDNGKNTNRHQNIDLLLSNFFKLNNINNIEINKKFKASKDYTNSKWVNKQFNVSSLQIEISYQYRNKENLVSVSKGLYDFIKYLKPIVNYNVLFGEINKTNKIKPLNRLEIVNNNNLTVNHYYFLDRPFENSSLLLKEISSKNDIPFPVFRITKRMLQKRNFKNKFAALIYKDNITTKYLKPPFEEILKQDECLISVKLWIELNKPKYILIKSSDILAKLKVKKTVKRNGNYVFLNYFQRKLLKLEMPHKITNYDFNKFKTINEELANAYEVKNDFYILKELGRDEFYKLSLIYKKNFGSFLVYATNKKRLFNPKILLDFFIGVKKITLRSCRSYGVDEANNIVRISKDNGKVLGIDEGDIIIIKSFTNSIKAKALFFENTEYIFKENGIIDENDIEYLISIPISLRGKLNIYDVGEVVSIKRDTYFLLLKNINTQFFSLIGMVITIFTLPEKILPENLKVYVIFVLLPFVFWLTFSKERSRIK